MESQTVVYKGIDLFKFLFSIVVVCIHTTVGEFYGIKEMAVPYFFMASGFFFFSGTAHNNSDAVKSYEAKWLIRIVKMYLIWTLIYLPFAVYGFAQDGTSITKAIALYCRNVVFVGENYLSWPLWYLLGLIWAGLIIIFLRRLRFPIWLVFAIGVCLAVIAETAHLEDVSIYSKVFSSTRNGIFVGLPLMAAGGLISSINFRKIKPYVYLLFSVISFIAMRFNGLFMYSTVVSLFLYSASIVDVFHFKDAQSKVLRTSSTIVYLTHMLFAGVLLIAGMQKGLPLFFIVSALSVILSLVLVKTSPGKVMSLLF